MIKLDKGNPQAVIVGKSGAPGALATATGAVGNDVVALSNGLGGSAVDLQSSNEKLELVGKGPHVGIVKSYNATKGFGFIQCSEVEAIFGSDVFLHKSEIDSTESVGKEVQFMIFLSTKGQPQAQGVTVLSVDGDEKTAVELAADLEAETFSADKPEKRKKIGI